MSDSTRQTVDRYDRRASRYERRWAAYLRHTHGRFMKKLDFGKNDRLLDLSAGTGLLASDLLSSGRSFGSLTLNEPSRGMLDRARSRLSGRDDLTFTSYAAENFPWEEYRFDAIFILNALHFYPRQREILRGAYEALAGGGRLYLLDWDRSGWFRPINAFIQVTMAEYINTRSLEEIRGMLQETGFAVRGMRSWRFRWWKLCYAEGFREG
ncbi:MAG: methyltransferase domain-containing protein [Balneolaceae bacterium]|nr:methyltransferase domain-containing protein [Balneolaceae bacterium]